MNEFETRRAGGVRAELAGMTMDAAEPRNPGRGALNEPAGHALTLAEAATDPSNDPCDLCEDALPGYVLDDLSIADRAWIVEHTKVCNYCRNELTSFEMLDDLLDLCDEVVATTQPISASHAAWGHFDSPIGPLSIAVSPQGVCEIGFGWLEDERAFAGRLIDRGFVPVRNQDAVKDVAGELSAYFTGARERFDLPVDLSGVSEFSRAVLTATAAVPFGETRTYADIARAIGKPGALRAVGNALNKNPVPLLVPCHRIVPTTGGIGKYAGTPAVKERLLVLEGALDTGHLRHGFA